MLLKLKLFLGAVLEGVYASTGAIETANTEQALEVIGAKLLIIKGVSQDLGSQVAVAWLSKADTTLGPIAQQVVDAVNGNAGDAASVVLQLVIAATEGQTGNASAETPAGESQPA